MLHPSVNLQPHQQRVRDEAEEAARTNTPFNKLLYWGTGSGKGIGALGIADALNTDASIVGPAALRQTLKGESLKALGHADYPISSYNAAAKGKAPQATTLIADEAQRLGSPSSQQSKAVLDMAEKARNVILMSATPVRNHPREFAPLLQALTGKPITHDEFEERYVGEEAVRPGLLGRLRGIPASTRPVITNAEELKNLLAGKVDVYEPTTPPVGVKTETVEAELKPRQAELYRGLFGRLPWLTRQKLRYRYDLTDKEMASARSFMTGPRQAALSDLPYRSPGPDAALKAFDNSGKHTTAFARLLDTLKDERAKAIVYSNFLDAGLKPYSAALSRGGPDGKPIPHATFHGGLSDEERRRLVDDFNASRTRVALVGPAGAEGISLKGAQKIQLLDKYWNSARNTQAKARGIRFDSHTGLPEDLQNVTVEQYVGRLPLRPGNRLLNRLGFNRDRDRETVDDYLERMSVKKDDLNNQLMDVIRSAAGTKQAVVSYVPRSALESIRAKGLMSSEAMLRDPEALASAAAGRGVDPEKFRAEAEAGLAGWKPDSWRGPNVMFKAPTKTHLAGLAGEHPLKRWDLAPVKIDLRRLMKDQPETRVHGQELMPYAEYEKKWTEEELKADKDDPSLRHRDLTMKELADLLKTPASKLWASHAKDDTQRYAPDVPHAAVVTPTGVIDPKYLKFAGDLTPDELRVVVGLTELVPDFAKESALTKRAYGVVTPEVEVGNFAPYMAYGFDQPLGDVIAQARAFDAAAKARGDTAKFSPHQYHVSEDGRTVEYDADELATRLAAESAVKPGRPTEMPSYPHSFQIYHGKVRDESRPHPLHVVFGAPETTKEAISLRLANKALDSSLSGKYSPERAMRFANRYGLWAERGPYQRSLAMNFHGLGNPVAPPAAVKAINPAAVKLSPGIQPPVAATMPQEARPGFFPRVGVVAPGKTWGQTLHEGGHAYDHARTGRVVPAFNERAELGSELMANRRGAQLAGAISGPMGPTDYLKWVRRSGQIDAYRASELRNVAGFRGTNSIYTVHDPVWPSQSAYAQRWLNKFKGRADAPQLLERIANPVPVARPQLAAVKAGTDGWFPEPIGPRAVAAARGPSSAPVQMDRLVEAKARSDRGDYEGKAALLREMIAARPADWTVDSDLGYVVGLTGPMGWRYHLPKNKIGDLLPRMTGVHRPA